MHNYSRFWSYINQQNKHLFLKLAFLGGGLDAEGDECHWGGEHNCRSKLTLLAYPLKRKISPFFIYRETFIDNKLIN